MTEITSGTAVVTGASGGIGSAIVRALLRDGWRVAAAYHSSAEKLKSRLGADFDSPNLLAVQANVTDHDSRLALLDRAEEAFGCITALVNTAGVAPKVRADLLEMTEESYDRVMDTNLKSTLFLTQGAVQRMLKARNSGLAPGLPRVIVNISSMSAYTSSVSRGEYCISKAGISMLTTLFADRLAAENILVYEVRPGIIETDMTAGVHGKYDAMIEDGVFPIARWGRPEDVAEAVSLLTSGRLPYSTGEVLNVDGGFHLRRL